MQYWYRTGEEIDGPFSLDEVRERHRRGQIPADAEIADAQGDESWKPLSTILPASELNLASLQAAEPRNLKAILGVAGSLSLILGVFSPLISVPIMGAFNYFQNGKGDGVIVLILAVLSLVLSVRRKYRGLWFSGFATAALLAFTFINFQVRLAKMKSHLKAELADNPFAGFANLTVEAVQMQWGWAILIVGTLLILAAAASKPQ